MRVVKNADELAGKLEEAQREAGAAFGRGEVFIERYIARAKHIEVQILGDTHGNLVHLWERDCSVQRRHQKVVEIAPSVEPAARAARRTSATPPCGCARPRATSTPARSSSSSTLDREEFFFIEVNPRIQVEHTVTEVVTGVDLVKSQILVAQGHKLHEAPLNIPQQDEIDDERLRDPVPHHDRRPGEQLHPRLRPADDLPLARRVRDPARRRQRLRRRGHHALLRLAAGEADHVGRDVRGVHQADRPRAPRVPHPRREDEHPVPRKPDPPPDVRQRRRDDDVHRQHAGAVPLQARSATARRRSSPTSAT